MPLSADDFFGAPPPDAPTQGMSADDFFSAPAPPTPPAAPPAQASTPGYVGSRFVGSLLQGAQNLGSAASLEMSQPDQADEIAAMPSGQSTVDKAMYGTDNVPPPNTVARYAGDVASAAGADPVGAVIAPGATAVGALGGTLASDANKGAGGVLPDWLARLIGSVAGGGIGAAAPRVATKAVAGAAPAAADASLGAVTGNKAITKNLTNAGQFGQTPLGQFQGVAGDTAAAVGAEATPMQIGQNLVAKATGWLKDRKDANDAGYDALRQEMPDPATTTASSAFAVNMPPGPKPPAIINDFAQRITNPKLPPPDFNELQNWRSEVGEAINGLQGGQGTGRLKQFYGALSKDMESTAQAQGGQQLVDKWKQLDAGYASDKAIVAKAFGSLPDATTTPEDAFAQLAANPAQNLTKLKMLVDKGVLDDNDIGNIASNQFYRLNANSDGIADPTTFARNMIAMRQNSPETVDFLFRRNPQDAAAFDDYLNTAKALHIGSGAATQAKARAAQNAMTEFAKRTGRAAIAGTVGRFIPGLGEAGALAGTLGALGEGAAPAAPALLQAPAKGASEATRTFLRGLLFGGAGATPGTPSGQQ